MKLALLAGVPVFGAFVLSALIARHAQRQAETAEALGSVEDLAQLTSRMTDVVHRLQAERALSAYAAATGRAHDAGLPAKERATDEALRALDGFMRTRDARRLPTDLRRDLKAAREQLAGLDAIRTKARAQDFDLEEYLDFHAKAADALIGATAALGQLSDDGELLRSIWRLVAAMQYIERTSREHALLSYVFGRSEFPPGTFRYFVTLLTEQQAYADSLRTSTGAAEFERLQKILRSASADEVEEMRRIALETTEETLSVDSERWFETQLRTMEVLRSIQSDLLRSVQNAVARKADETRAAVSFSIGLALAVLASSMLLGWIITRSLTRSVRVLADAARAVHDNGNFSIRAEKTSADELGLLTEAFNGMLAGIEERDQELRAHRQNLEALVEARTRELSERNEQMRLVLDNVDEGLAMIGPDGTLLGEASRAFADAFGNPRAGASFAETLAPNDPTTCSSLLLGYEQFMEDTLPAEVALDQLPKHLVRGGSQYSLAFKPVLRQGRPEGALLIARDVTAELASRQAEALQREQIRIFERIMRDRYGFLEFLEESRALIRLIREDALAEHPETLRAIHTLKGNAGMLEIQTLAQAAHGLEQALLEKEENAVHRALETLLATWDQVCASAAPITSDRSEERVEITREELELVFAAVREEQSHAAIGRLLLWLQQEPAPLRFRRIEEQLRALARRQGKHELLVTVDADGVRLPVRPLQKFWSNFVHVVRNVVAHGLESPEERARSGKGVENRVVLRATSDDAALTVEIADDGRGIDWAAVGERARAKGLPHRTRADLVRALFTDGISTTSAATQTAGRGVGMSAVLDAMKALGGDVEVSSEPGKGTRFRFVFPWTDALVGGAVPFAPNTPGARPRSYEPRSRSFDGAEAHAGDRS
ncbi:MAG TPA: nitrate- and nitrite sensing domain-containing protein [Polyangiaceae bacterium]|nr:nitrate- and nitrite sensing domain-containing protein [Polyangiaceae bacterium]